MVLEEVLNALGDAMPPELYEQVVGIRKGMEGCDLSYVSIWRAASKQSQPEFGTKL